MGYAGNVTIHDQRGVIMKITKRQLRQTVRKLIREQASSEYKTELDYQDTPRGMRDHVSLGTDLAVGDQAIWDGEYHGTIIAVEPDEGYGVEVEFEFVDPDDGETYSELLSVDSEDIQKA